MTFTSRQVPSASGLVSLSVTYACPAAREHARRALATALTHSPGVINASVRTRHESVNARVRTTVTADVALAQQLLALCPTPGRGEGFARVLPRSGARPITVENR